MIVDDYAIVREGLQLMLESDPELQVVASTASAEEALTLATARKPHIAILDTTLPGIDGVTATHK